MRPTLAVLELRCGYPCVTRVRVVKVQEAVLRDQMSDGVLIYRVIEGYRGYRGFEKSSAAVVEVDHTALDTAHRDSSEEEKGRTL